jgi:deazaflavin-dependent oxidoreductase (nitroreductase family)
MRRTFATPLVLALVGLGVARAADQPLPEVAAALQRIKGASSIELTTTGRKTGKPHTRPVWFVIEGDAIIVQAGKSGKTDWYRNLLKTPTALVTQDKYTFRTRAKPVTDPARVEAIHKLFVGKYTTAWLLSFVGSSIGQGRPVELEPIAVAVKR